MSSPLRLGVPGLTERELLVSSWLSTPTTVSKADWVVGLEMGCHNFSSSSDWGITFSVCNVTD